MPIVAPDPATMDNLTEREQAALAGHASTTATGTRATRRSRARGRRPSATGSSTRRRARPAWILEKFWAWTDCNGHPENALTRDEMLDNIMLYWLPDAARLLGAPVLGELHAHARATRSRIPVGCSIFPKEIFRASRRWAEKRFTNLVYWNELDKGGHFAAFEQPETFVDEVRKCFRNVRA